MTIHYIGEALDGALVETLEGWLQAAREGRPIRLMAVVDLGGDSMEVTRGTFNAIEVAGWCQYLTHKVMHE